MRPLFCLLILSLLAGCNVRLPASSATTPTGTGTTPPAATPSGTGQAGK